MRNDRNHCVIRTSKITYLVFLIIFFPVLFMTFAGGVEDVRGHYIVGGATLLVFVSIETFLYQVVEIDNCLICIKRLPPFGLMKAFKVEKGLAISFDNPITISNVNGKKGKIYWTCFSSKDQRALFERLGEIEKMLTE